jgi:hypothetical protein
VDPAAAEAASESVVAADVVLNQAAAAGMPQTIVDTLRAGAYESFLSASHVATYISVVMVVIAALVVFFLLPVITPPERGDLAVGAPQDATDALVLEEIAHYREEAAEEYGLAKEDPPA